MITALVIYYCIVFNLYAYIALLAVHKNQKRFTLRDTQGKEKKDAIGSPVKKVDHIEGGSWFQSTGPMIAPVRD